MFPDGSQQVSALRRAALQGAGTTVVSPDLSGEGNKKDQEAGQQASVRSAVCSHYAYLGLPNT